MPEAAPPPPYRPSDPRSRLIVALDLPSLEDALKLVEALGDDVQFYKVGYRLFFAEGLPAVERLRSLGKEVFLDLKLDDIDATIATAVEVLGGRARFLTLHGGPATIRAAVRGRGSRSLPLLLSVPLLSSVGPDELRDNLGLDGIRAPDDFLMNYLTHRAQATHEAGADGWIASGEAIRTLREKLGDEPLIVSPGIRPAGESSDEHRRSTDPRTALGWGADFLVVGRPITLHSDPRGAAHRIQSEIAHALAVR